MSRSRRLSIEEAESEIRAVLLHNMSCLDVMKQRHATRLEVPYELVLEQEARVILCRQALEQLHSMGQRGRTHVVMTED